MIRMGVERIKILGNDYVGAWSVATDKFFLLGSEIKRKTEEIVKGALGVEVVRTTVSGSSLLGIFIAANSNGILLPNFMERDELALLKKSLPGVRLGVLETDLNALKNNILANDRIAIINPGYSDKEEKEIKDVLGVEAVRMAIAGFHTIGANNIITNKGFVLNNRASEEEKKRIESLLNMRVDQSTANLGSVNIGLCAVANSHGLIAGEATTGFELARMAQSLDIE